MSVSMKWLPMVLPGLLIAAALYSAPTLAQSRSAPPLAPTTMASSAPANDGVVDLDTMVVSGVQPGPGLWKVSKGDHTLWILGTLSPLPKKMTWLPRDVDAAIAQSQEILGPPGVSFDPDVGIIRGAFLIPSLLKARKNPDGRTLQQVLPADLHARWLALKLKYIGRDAGVEKWRPMFAAYELYKEALDDSGLVQGGVIGPAISKAAKRHKVKQTSPVVKVKIEQPKKVIKEFSSASLDDIECFGKTMTRLETDLATMTARANAWAIGDIEALRALPYDDQNRECLSAFIQAGFAQKRGMGDLPARVQAAWLAAAGTALESNQITFATLPISDMLNPEGYLGKLRAKGYIVEEP